MNEKINRRERRGEREKGSRLAARGAPPARGAAPANQSRLKPELQRALQPTNLARTLTEQIDPAAALAWHDSIAHAAAVTGHNPELFKKAKRLGSPGFKGSRVCPELVLKFVSDNAERFRPRKTQQEETEGTERRGGGKLKLELQPELQLEDPKEVKLWEEVRKLRLANDIKEGKYVLRTLGAEAMAKSIAQMKASTEPKLCNELPATMAGLTPAQGRVYAKKLWDQILEAWEECAKFWGI